MKDRIKRWMLKVELSSEDLRPGRKNPYDRLEYRLYRTLFDLGGLSASPFAIRRRLETWSTRDLIRLRYNINIQGGSAYVQRRLAAKLLLRRERTHKQATGGK